MIKKTNMAYQTPKPWRSPLRHDQSIFAPCLLASSHSMAPRGNETKARAWDGTSTKKKRVAPKASSCLIHLGCLMTFHAVFQDIFGFILLSPFQSFDLVHPWSTPFILILSPFFWLAKHLHAGTLPYFLTTRLSHVLWTAGRWWDGRWVGMGGDVHDFHSALVRIGEAENLDCIGRTARQLLLDALIRHMLSQRTLTLTNASIWNLDLVPTEFFQTTSFNSKRINLHVPHCNWQTERCKMKVGCLHHFWALIWPKGRVLVLCSQVSVPYHSAFLFTLIPSLLRLDL